MHDFSSAGRIEHRIDVEWGIAEFEEMFKLLLLLVPVRMIGSVVDFAFDVWAAFRDGATHSPQDFPLVSFDVDLYKIYFADRPLRVIVVKRNATHQLWR